ncbi:MAG: hypothetical protein R2911_10700 [Caldilineaceae bacterium]
MKPQLETRGLNLVALGHFTPQMFHPSWFALQNLINQQEAESAEIQLIHPDAAIFQIDWLQVKITRERFQVATLQEPYFEALRDFAIGAFSILKYTPLTALGINHEFTYSVATEKAWHKVGDTIAPKQEWADVLTKPGIRSFIMEGERTDQFNGYIRVKIEPIDTINPIRYMIMIEVNDHYDLVSTNISRLKILLLQIN